jgi:hypothetical protein
MTHNYTLIKNFLPEASLERVIEGSKRTIKRFYDSHHLREHTAYFSDRSDNRESYAFSVAPDSSGKDLPFISTDLLAETSRQVAFLSTGIREHLEVSADTRLLLNFQIYKGNNKPVTKHFDGEYFDFKVNEDSTLHVNYGLRPKHVAVLVLHNDSEGGGTRLHYPDGSSEVIVGQAGDLLVFRNDILYHSVDELTGVATREDQILRMTIGWRSLEENVSLIYDGETKDGLDIASARRMHRTFLDNNWPSIYAEYVNVNKPAAF